MGFKRIETTIGSGNIIRRLDIATHDGSVRYGFSVMVSSKQSVGINVENLSGDDLRALADNIDELRKAGNLAPPRIIKAEISED